MTQVVIVGAGPVGTWLACELRLHGISVVLLEQRPDLDLRSRAAGMQPRILDTFAMRGLIDRFLPLGVPVPTNHFGGASTRLNFGVLDTKHPFLLALPQAEQERILRAAAVERGAELRLGHRVTALRQDESGVTLDVETPDRTYTQTADWVVGCDGAGSAVRQLAGFEFPGTPHELFGFLADAKMHNPPPGPVSRANERGTMMMVPFQGDVWRIAAIAVADMRRPKDAPIDLDDIERHAIDFFGHALGLHSPIWISRFGNATRQATSYRSGRVLLAGDAAHMFFPAGGQGVNVGLHDAHNLGWKLAATINGWATPNLLDSYGAERIPAAQAVMHNTRAQLALFAAENPEQVALRDVFSEALTHPSVNALWAHRIGGYDVTYPATADETAHAGLGQVVPDLDLDSADGTSLYALLRTGRFVLLELGGDSGSKRALGGWPDRVVHAEAKVIGRTDDWRNTTAALVRPDGHLAWATTLADPAARQRRALHALDVWCGARALQPA